MDALGYLAEHKGETISAATLLDRFWPNALVGDNAVQKIVSEIRHAMDEDPKHPRYVQTIPKRGYRLIADVADSNETAPLESESESEETSVAVLRFVDIDGNPDTQFLLLGLAEALIDGLSRIQSLRVASRTESFSFSPESVSVAQIGDALSVSHVLEGSVQRDGNTLRVSAQLIRVADGFHLYSEQFDSDLSGVLEIQDAIASRVVSALSVHLDESQRQRMLNCGTSNVAAYLLALEGSHKSVQDNMHDLHEGLENYLSAIELDPDFPRAYAGAISIAQSLMLYESPQEIDRLQSLTQRLFQQARKHDAVTDEIRHGMSRTVHGGHLAEVEKELFRQLGSVDVQHSADLYLRYGRVLAGGRLYRTALKFMDRTIQDHPDLEIEVIQERGNSTLRLEGLEAGIVSRRKVLQQKPDHIGQLVTLTVELSKLGRYTEAEVHLAHLESIDDGSWTYGARASVAALKGELPLGSERLEQAIADELCTAHVRGIIYFILGDVPQGVQYWRNLDTRDMQLISLYAPVSEMLFADGVTDDPEYQQVLVELGIGKSWTRYLEKRVKDLEAVTGIPLLDD